MGDKLRLYAYANCSTCKAAIKYLEKKGVSFETISIVERPPTVAELRKMLSFYEGKIGKLFNTSGLQYRELKLGEKLPTMSEAEALTLLSKNGKLVKRPFVLGNGGGRVGFRENEWKALLAKG